MKTQSGIVAGVALVALPALESLLHHDEKSALVSAPRERLFAFADDLERLSPHMNQSSWRLG